MIKNIPIQPPYMFCQKDGTTPDIAENLYNYLTPVDRNQALSYECTIDLTPYRMDITNDTKSKAIGKTTVE